MDKEAQITKSLIGISGWFNERWRPRMGAIDGRDLSFIAGLIERERPKRLLEIGCASGLSTSVIAALLEEYGGGRLDTLDLNERFYADKTKPVGYLLEQALPHPSVTVAVHTKKTSLDAVDIAGTRIDLCFIDAAHKHPWPLIDTLAVLPAMRKGGVIIHHDLHMYRGRTAPRYGPKILFDQTPAHALIRVGDLPRVAEKAGLRTRQISNNIYAMRVPDDLERFAERIAQGFYLPWDIGPRRIEDQFASDYAAFLRKTYSGEVSNAFDVGMLHHNPPAHRKPPTESPHRKRKPSPGLLRAALAYARRHYRSPARDVAERGSEPTGD